MTVTKGRIVFYWTHRPARGGGVEVVSIPAMVTEVDEKDRSVDLTAFPPMMEPCLLRGVPETTTGPRYGCWSWPPMVEPGPP